jgi:O-antigen/teichoic acid export membrane protein
MPLLRTILRNSAVLLGGTFLSKALVFASYLVLTRQLGADDFGRFTFLFVYVGFFELIGDAGLEALVLREMERRPERAAQAFGDALVLRALLVLAAIPAALALFPWVRADPRLQAALLALACGTLIVTNRRPSLRSTFELPYRATLRMGTPVLLGTLSEVLALVLILLFVPQWGLSAAVASQILGPLPFAVILAFVASRMLRPRIGLDRARITTLAATASPFLATLLFNFVLVRADVFALERFRGPAEVGLYAAPVRLVELANLLPVILMTSIYPLMARSYATDPSRLDALARASVRALAAILVPLAVFEIAAAEPLIRLVFGDAFAGGAPVLRLLAAASLFTALDVVLGARLVAAGLERRNLHLVIMAAATNVAAVLVLVPRHGVEGAAIALLLAYGVRLASGFAFANTRAPTRAAIGAAAPASLAGAAAFAATRFVDGRVAVTTVAALAVYVFLLVLLRGARPSDWSALTGRSTAAARRVP